MMDGLKIQGQIEVILEDSEGRVKFREVKNNTITRAGLKYFLFQMMQASNISNVTRILTGQATGTAITSFGIYAMRTPVDIKRDDFRPPFVDSTYSRLHPDVTFYNTNGATTEALAIMIPNDAKCHMGKGDDVQYTLEYVKNSGEGVVQSVVIGRTYDADTQYLMYVRDPDLNSMYHSNVAHYVLEHTADGTILHKVRSSSYNSHYSVNLKTKELVESTSSVPQTNMTNNYAGVVVNGTIFKAGKLSSGTGGSNYNVQITYVKNWRASTASSTFTIPFTARDGMSINTTVTPLIVALPGENKFEVFLTTSIGVHAERDGANIQKAIVDVSDLDNITWVFVDMGVLPYAISNHGTSVGQYVSGYFDGDKYYLPFYYRVGAEGALETTVTSALMEGIIISKDFKTIHKEMCVRPASNVFAAFVQADELVQLCVNTTDPRYVDASQVLSGASFSAPVTKNATDVLRIIYRYKLS